MAESYLVYVDESGSEGGEHGQGASEFMVIGAGVLRADRAPSLPNIFMQARYFTRKPPDWTFPKFSKLNSEVQRFLICKLISEAPITIIAIIAHKPPIFSQRLNEDRGELYFFLSRLLVERVSWACRDIARAGQSPGDNTARIIFSKQKILRYEDFKQDVRLMKQHPEQYRSNATWQHIDPDKIQAVQHSDDDPALKVADYIASAFGRAIEYKQFGITDDRFVRLFSQNVYRSSRGRAFANGIKLWPREAEALVDTDPRFGWLRHYY